MINNTITILLLLLFFQSCYLRQNRPSSYKKQEENSLETNKDSLISNLYLEKHNSISLGCDLKRKLIVHTTFITVPDSISFYRPLILNQDLVFYFEKKPIKTVSFPFHKKLIEVNSQTFRVNNTAICKIKCHQGKQGNWIYNIQGSYNFDPPHEFFGLISDKGEWLWYFYGARNETYESFGDLEEYLEEYGEDINNLRDMIKVCP